jgi:hypothetical protein
MSVTKVAAAIAERYELEGPRAALRRYDEAWRTLGKDAADPYIVVAIKLCRRRCVSETVRTR